MNHEPTGNLSVPAPCLVDAGVVVGKADMLRLLQDLGRVAYSHYRDNCLLRGGEGYIMEVFADPSQSTLVANQTLYINVHSFDYLEMGRLDDDRPHFDLIQENNCLRLVPLSDPLREQGNRSLNAAAFEAMVAEALSASWDACMDDDRNFPD